MDSIHRAINLKKELDQLRPLSKEDEERIMQKFRLDWNYHSNNIEGNSLTYGETKALLLHHITAQGKSLKDHLEITGHNEAIDWILEVIKEDRPLTETFIRELHKLILKQPYEVEAKTPEGKPSKKRIQVGVYKTTPNHVETSTGEIFRFASPEETPAMMHDLMEWFRNEKSRKDVNAILLASEFHYKLIRIHPFDDGNGRMARILMNFILMQFGYPPVVIKTEDKAGYYAVLRQADAGMITPFVEYITKNLCHSLDLMIRGAKGENIEDTDDVDKEIRLLEQKLKFVGNQLDVRKDEVAILHFYDNSVSKLFEKFTHDLGKFSQFYIESEYEINIYNNNEGLGRSFKNPRMEEIRINLTSNLKNIELNYKFRGFNRKGFGEFAYNSTLHLSFEYDAILVSDSMNEYQLKKNYAEPLYENEIQKLVSIEVKRHKDAIEQKIQQLKK